MPLILISLSLISSFHFRFISIFFFSCLTRYGWFGNCFGSLLLFYSLAYGHSPSLSLYFYPCIIRDTCKRAHCRRFCCWSQRSAQMKRKIIGRIKLNFDGCYVSFINNIYTRWWFHFASDLCTLLSLVFVLFLLVLLLLLLLVLYVVPVLLLSSSLSYPIQHTCSRKTLLLEMCAHIILKSKCCSCFCVVNFNGPFMYQLQTLR